MFRGEVFAISDCLVLFVYNISLNHNEVFILLHFGKPQFCIVNLCVDKCHLCSTTIHCTVRDVDENIPSVPRAFSQMCPSLIACTLLKCDERHVVGI